MKKKKTLRKQVRKEKNTVTSKLKIITFKLVILYAKKITKTKLANGIPVIGL